MRGYTRQLAESKDIFVEKVQCSLGTEGQLSTKQAKKLGMGT